MPLKSINQSRIFPFLLGWELFNNLLYIKVFNTCLLGWMRSISKWHKGFSFQCLCQDKPEDIKDFSLSLQIYRMIKYINLYYTSACLFIHTRYTHPCIICATKNILPSSSSTKWLPESMASGERWLKIFYKEHTLNPKVC